MKRTVLWSVLIIFNLLGLLLLTTAIEHLLTAHDSRNWPTADGEIKSVEVVEVESDGMTRAASEPERPSYSLEVQYAYNVNGEQFQGSRITVEDMNSNDPAPARKLAMEFAVGQTVPVHYDPNDPQQALLRPGEYGGTIPSLIMGIVFMIAPTAMVLFIGGTELIPDTVRLWWNIKYGKYSEGYQERQPTEAAPPIHPFGDDFRESILCWQPGQRLEVVCLPPNPGSLISLCGLFGVLFSLLIGVPAAKFLLGQEGSWAEYFAIIITLFVLLTTASFAWYRWKERGSGLTIDWTGQSMRAYREFTFSHQGSIHDINGLVVRCVPVKDRRTRYRATVELDLSETPFVAFHSYFCRRKAEAARRDASQLAEPLAAALRIPLRFEGWPEDPDR